MTRHVSWVFIAAAWIILELGGLVPLSPMNLPC